jgi:hypothetical protein
LLEDSTSNRVHIAEQALSTIADRCYMIPMAELERSRPGLMRAVPLFAVSVLAAAMAVRLFVAPATDSVAAAERAARQAAQKVAQPLHLIRVEHRLQVVDDLGLYATERNALATAVAEGRLRLAWPTVEDSDAEDGDKETVTSFGLSGTVPVLHAPAMVPVRVAVAARNDERPNAQ